VLLTLLLAFQAMRPGTSARIAAHAIYAPLWLYNGSWKVSKKDSATGAKPDELLNECAQVGRYFTCQQTVNGVPSELLVFLPAKTTGQYYTQSIMPDGRAGGRGDLAIDGDKWIYSSNWNEGGKTTFYKTVNVFSGKDRIHYEQQESTNNKDWKTTGSGDEVRTAAGKTTVAR
jgi:hypothetical protein